jgi:hypothetical protein
MPRYQDTPLEDVLVLLDQTAPRVFRYVEERGTLQSGRPVRVTHDGTGRQIAVIPELDLEVPLDVLVFAFEHSRWPTAELVTGHPDIAPTAETLLEATPANDEELARRAARITYAKTVDGEAAHEEAHQRAMQRRAEAERARYNARFARAVDAAETFVANASTDVILAALLHVLRKKPRFDLTGALNAAGLVVDHDPEHSLSPKPTVYRVPSQRPIQRAPAPTPPEKPEAAQQPSTARSVDPDFEPLRTSVDHAQPIYASRVTAQRRVNA